MTHKLDRLNPKLISIGLIGPDSLDKTGEPFEKAINFIQVLSVIITEDNTNRPMRKFMNVLSEPEVNINPENLRDFTDKIKQLSERDEELITQLGEEWLTIASYSCSIIFPLLFQRKQKSLLRIIIQLRYVSEKLVRDYYPTEVSEKRIKANYSVAVAS